MNDAPTTQAKRVAFYVDGYNLYHSINNIVKNNPGLNYLKWLDLRKLFSNFLVSGQEELVDIFFYTAEPTHTKPDVQNRYRALLDAYQRFLNIRAVYGKFKAKPPMRDSTTRFTLSPRTAIWLPPLPWRKGYARDSSIC